MVVLDHDNDPIASVSPRLIYARPHWLASQHGRGVPASMGWIPVITFVHVAVDAMNAMRTVPGEFKSFGHDYRADTARFVHAALGLPAVTEEQMQAVERVLRELELDRGRRISRLAVGGTRTGGASWRRSLRQHHRGEQLFAPAAAAPGGPEPRSPRLAYRSPATLASNPPALRIADDPR